MAAILRPTAQLSVGSGDSALSVPALVYAVAFFVYETLQSQSVSDGVAHHVHAVGAVLGALYGLAYRRHVRQPLSRKFAVDLLRAYLPLLPELLAAFRPR